MFNRLFKGGSKTYLKLLMLAGVLALLGGGAGTFATFNAEVTNAGNTFQTGSIFLHETNGATTCTSESGSLNVKGCSALFDVSSLTEGYSNHIDLTLSNAGTIDASTFTVTMPSCTESNPTIATTSGTNNASATTVNVTGLNQALLTGTPIKIGSNSYTIASDASSGASSITITPGLAAQDNGGTAITIDSSGIGSAGLCGQLQFAIAEGSGGFSNFTCLYGGSTDATNGCNTLTGTVADFTANQSPFTLSGGLTAGQKRYIRILIAAPTLDNTAQNQEAKFDLDWKIQ